MSHCLRYQPSLYIEDILVLQIPVPPGAEVFALAIDQPRYRNFRHWCTGPPFKQRRPRLAYPPCMASAQIYTHNRFIDPLGSPGIAAPARLFHSFVLPPSSSAGSPHLVCRRTQTCCQRPCPMPRIVKFIDFAETVVADPLKRSPERSVFLFSGDAR